MSKYPITVKPFGDNAILITWPNEVHEAILDDILAFKNLLRSKVDDTYEMVPAYNSLALVSPNKIVEFESLKQHILGWYAAMDGTTFENRFLWKLPVCYDMEFGLDLDEVAVKLNLSVADVIKEHASHEYTVFGIGFLPGFMYLGGLPKKLETVRKSEPRLQVPKGSVGLAGKQTGIYPQESPGGWNIIGSCPIPIFNPKAENPCFVNVGDKIKFEAIPRAEYELHKIESEVGIYEPEKIKLDA